MQRQSRLAITHFYRRRHPRIDLCLPVEYAISQSPARHITRSGAIGGGGIMLHLPMAVPVGTVMELIIHLPDRIKIACTARVVWTELLTGRERNNFKTGVEFEQISEEALQTLRHFIEEQQNPFETAPELLHERLRHEPFE